ncbi:MAG: hypothetical protein N3B16_01460 [Candidatus Aminicenantes bacterium]|nr:hypothetical protein [Candidatus Aminicenantes bacterium]
MEGKDVNPTLKIPLLEEVEKRLNELLRQKKEAIEKELEEKIRREREEAEKKIRQIEEEFNKGKELLEDYHQILADFEAERQRLQKEIKEHFERVIKHQTEIEKLASLTLEEIKEVEILNKQLETLEKKSGEKITLIRQQIEEKYGLVTEIPEIPAEEEFKFNLEKELARLKKIKELLAEEKFSVTPIEESRADLSGPALAEETVLAGEVPLMEEEPEALTKNNLSGQTSLVDLDRELPKKELTIAQEEMAAVEEGLPEESEMETQAEEVIETFQEVYERLERFRQVHSEGNGEVAYFEKGEIKIIDVEGLVAAMNEAIEASKRLYQKLAQTDSPKDHFFIKQEIINQQEILRKHLLHVIKLCEKEGFLLPAFTEKVINVNLLRDLLERLSIENWSDDSDFQSVTEYIENLKEYFYQLITPPVSYLKALLLELGDF